MSLSFGRSDLMTLSLVGLLFAPTLALGQSPTDSAYVVNQSARDRFALFAAGSPAPLYASARDYPGVIRAVRDLEAAIGRVTGTRPAVSTDSFPRTRQIVVVGTLGKNEVIDRLVRENKLDVRGVAGRWETFLTQIVEKPMSGVDRALVIAGSDKRGTIYGVYD